MGKVPKIHKKLCRLISDLRRALVFIIGIVLALAVYCGFGIFFLISNLT